MPDMEHDEVVTRLLERLNDADESERRRILEQMVCHLDSMFLTALTFAVSMTPGVPRKESTWQRTR